ncbi:MAG: fluoride efflux transporter CrcB [Flavobacteriales bacterium]|nr:fluoride efflux transporter CrcB [Flavobacteriales bacterium]
MNLWTAVFLGGGIGSVMRFGISKLLLALDLRGAFPWATLLCNVLASFILAWVLLRMQGSFQHRPSWAAFLTVGICGGFSTFSTFSYENFLLIREGLVAMAVVNIALSLLACTAAFILIARLP